MTMKPDEGLHDYAERQGNSQQPPNGINRKRPAATTPPPVAPSFAENADPDDPGNPPAAFLAERSAAATGDLALAGAAAAVIRTGGRIYYLAYVSRQPADGRFHGIRVTGSAPGVQVHARKGCYTGRGNDPA